MLSVIALCISQHRNGASQEEITLNKLLACHICIEVWILENAAGPCKKRLITVYYQHYTILGAYPTTSVSSENTPLENETR